MATLSTLGIVLGLASFVFQLKIALMTLGVIVGVGLISILWVVFFGVWKGRQAEDEPQ